jgi:putative addiction module component (TIGR02574 family)
MPMTKDQILAEAKSLNAQEREQLIEDLRQIDAGDDLSAAQRDELRRRLEALRRGEVKPIDGDQAMRELREELGMR